MSFLPSAAVALASSSVRTVGDALLRLDRAIGGARPLSPIATSSYIPLADNSGQQMLISYDEAVQKNPVVFGVWSTIVQQLATTGILIEQRQKNGVWARATDHDIEKLLNEPAKGLGLTDTLQWFFNPWMTEGNSLTVPVYDDPKKPPMGLVPLDWRYMTAWARPGGPVELWASSQAGEPVPLFPSEVVHLSWHPPTAGAIGIAPVASLETSVNVADAAKRMLMAQYNNGLHFGGFLSFPKDMTADQMPSDTEIDAMKAQWQKTYGGIDSAFAVAVLKGGLQFEKVSMSVADAEILNAADLTAADVYHSFGHRRSDFEDVQGVTVEQRNRSLHRALIPRTTRAADVITAQLIRRHDAWRDFRLKFDLSDLLKGTFREELEAGVYAFTNGMTNRDESREMVGMAAVGDAESKKYFVPHAQLNPGSDGRTKLANSRDTSRETREIPGAGDTAD